MGSDTGLTNHRYLGRATTEDYDISWYLEEDFTHPKDFSIVKITICNGMITEQRHLYPGAVLRNIGKELDILTSPEYRIKEGMMKYKLVASSKSRATEIYRGEDSSLIRCDYFKSGTEEWTPIAQIPPELTVRYSNGETFEAEKLTETMRFPIEYRR